MTACDATYSPSGLPPRVTLHCLRMDADEQGRHRGRHHAWQDMPGGERQVSVPDEDRPGWLKWATETYEPWVRLWTWDQGGASGSSRREASPLVCPTCGTLDYPESRVPAQAAPLYRRTGRLRRSWRPDPQECFHCRLWAQRVHAYTAGWQNRTPRDRRQTRLIRLRNDDGSPSPRLNAWAEGVTGAYGDRAYTIRWDDGDQRGPASSMWDCGAIPWWLDDAFPPNASVVHPEHRNAPVPTVVSL